MVKQNSPKQGIAINFRAHFFFEKFSVACLTADENKIIINCRQNVKLREEKQKGEHVEVKL